MPDCLCMLKHARVVPQQSHGGGGPWARALEHSSLAGSAGSWLTSASTRLPSLSHLISLTAATKQIEGTAELTPFHGNVFYCPHPAFYGHYGLCVVHKHTHMSTEIYQSRCPLRSLKKHMEASMYFASTWLPVRANDEYGGSRFGGSLAEICMKIMTLFCCICVHTGCRNHNFFLRKSLKKPRNTLSALLQHIHVLQMHRILTDFHESSIILFNVDVIALNLYSCSLNGCQGGKKQPSTWPRCSTWWMYGHFHVEPEGAVCHGLQKWLFPASVKHLCHTCLHPSKQNVQEIRGICGICKYDWLNHK